ncbi:hypothetical protein Q8W71_00500 [Methylobacterium sp. NEAU 140]|uniref:hypothetical protein n=1 Tax=Methylobacterium sp. NEAU 140 TaxID=3064945 RepID=UPI0027334736|nr:hypothetical protein [Methylobacterium sp. NEAU 140]MDP4021089.1 hypothetical protein [Methylobacterium sp. NEAU 140]
MYHTNAHQVGQSFETAAYSIAGALGSALVAGRLARQAARAEQDAELADAYRAVAARVRSARLAAGHVRRATAARAETARAAEEDELRRLIMARARVTAA